MKTNKELDVRPVSPLFSSPRLSHVIQENLTVSPSSWHTKTYTWPLISSMFALRDKVQFITWHTAYISWAFKGSMGWLDPKAAYHLWKTGFLCSASLEIFLSTLQATIPRKVHSITVSGKAKLIFYEAHSVTKAVCPQTLSTCIYFCRASMCSVCTSNSSPVFFSNACG